MRWTREAGVGWPKGILGRTGGGGLRDSGESSLFLYSSSAKGKLMILAEHDQSRRDLSKGRKKMRYLDVAGTCTMGRKE